MQTIKGYLATFLAVLAAMVALWLGTLVFFTLLACSAAAAIAYWLGTGPQPISLRLPPGAAPPAAGPGPRPDATADRSAPP